MEGTGLMNRFVAPVRPTPLTSNRLAFRSPCARRSERINSVAVNASVVAPGSSVLVAGAAGGVGQLVTARLLESGYHVKALTRDLEKAERFFGKDTENLEIVIGDLRDADKIKDFTEGVDAVCCVVGTTAFPSKRWDGNNSCEQTDKIAVGNLIKGTPKDVKRFVLTTSAGVTRSDKFPFVLMDVFNVLTYKRMAEKMLMSSGLPYTIFRPSRLTDGPYTSFDLNTVLQATRGSRRDVHLSLEDNFSGEASRISIAEAIVQSLNLPIVENQAFAIESVEGQGPEQDSEKWEEVFSAVTC
ncbi:hypothetical protein BSKO_06563 [Bryopsis sp. KO-2023]|nr:hypothetical protein BSKO_06563 [Bryopsis sp. KO-2023]